MRSSFGVKDEDSGSDLAEEDLKDGCALVIGLSGEPRSFSTAEDLEKCIKKKVDRLTSFSRLVSNEHTLNYDSSDYLANVIE